MRTLLTLSALIMVLAACEVEPDTDTTAATDTLHQGCGSYGDWPLGFFTPGAQLHATNVRQSVDLPQTPIWLNAGLVVEDAPSAAMQAARSMLETCAPVAGALGRADEADLRLTELSVEGAVVAGETVTVRLGMAEVSGRGHMEYPAMTLKVDPPGAEIVGEGGLIRYGLIGCDETVETVTVRLPDDLEPGTAVRFTALTGFGFCDDAPACTQTDAAVAERIAVR
jgi:hypothetical protein